MNHVTVQGAILSFVEMEKFKAKNPLKVNNRLNLSRCQLPSVVAHIQTDVCPQRNRLSFSLQKLGSFLWKEELFQFPDLLDVDLGCSNVLGFQTGI